MSFKKKIAKIFSLCNVWAVSKNVLDFNVATRSIVAQADKRNSDWSGLNGSARVIKQAAKLP